MSNIIWFIIGMVLGASLGMFITSLCVVSGRESDNENKLYKELNDKSV